MFFSSARYTNTAGLAYALCDDREPFIGVHANKSTHGDKIAEMISPSSSRPQRSA